MDHFCLFAFKVNVTQEQTSSRASVHSVFQTQRAVHQSRHFILKTICHRDKGKEKVGQNNKQTLHELGVIVWAISLRHVTISISNSGRTNRLRGGIRDVNHWWNKSLLLLLCYCRCHIYMLKNGNLLLGAGEKICLLWVSSDGKYSWLYVESSI